MSGPPTEQLASHVRLARAMEDLLPEITGLAQEMIAVFDGGGRVYTFGNGGSAADAQHLAGELVGRYRRERRPLPAASFAVDSSVMTCIGNDYSYEEVFARQVTAFARPGDMVVAFTTTGRSPNVVRGLEAAREAGAQSVLIAGGGGGRALDHADRAIVVPSDVTPRVQEMHLIILHLVSEHVDAWAADEKLT